MPSSPLAELERLIEGADPRRRADAARQLGQLFADGAANFRPEHVALFDGVLLALSRSSDMPVRAALAERLAPLANAPPLLVGNLVRDNQIRVSGPLLRLSPVVDQPILIEIAKTMGQDHLRAIAERRHIDEQVTDVLVRRGDREVMRGVAANATAQFSSQGYASLVRRAEQDGVLAITIGQRADLPEPMLQDLLALSVGVVRRRLFEQAMPARRTVIGQSLAATSRENGAAVQSADFGAAQAEVLALHRSGRLNKDALLQFANERKYEQTVALLSAISALPVSAVDKIVSQERRDSMLVLGKALALDWPIVRAVMSLRSGPGRTAASDLEQARINFERLSAATAQRIVKFWKQRPPM